LLGPTPRLAWTFEVISHFEATTKYYEYMGWGAYSTEYPDWDCVTYGEHGSE